MVLVEVTRDLKVGLVVFEREKVVLCVVLVIFTEVLSVVEEFNFVLVVLFVLGEVVAVIIEEVLAVLKRF